MDLSGTVKTPFGHAPKKMIVIGAGVVVVVAGVYYWRSRSGSSSASSSSTDTSTAATDPATGYPTGSAEDIAALQAQQQMDTAYGAGADGSTAAGGSGAISTPPTSGGFATNAQWAQAAEEYLTNTAGGDPATVAAALGAYISGAALTDAQVAVVQSAIALEGYPPVAGATGYPPHIKNAVPVSSPPKTGSGSGTGSGGTTKPPAKPPAKPPTGTHKYPERREFHRVAKGENYSELASKFGTHLTGQQLWAYQSDAHAGHSAQAAAELKKQGANLIKTGQEIAIPYPKG